MSIRGNVGIPTRTIVTDTTGAAAVMSPGQNSALISHFGSFERMVATSIINHHQRTISFMDGCTARFVSSYGTITVYVTVPPVIKGTGERLEWGVFWSGFMDGGAFNIPVTTLQQSKRIVSAAGVSAYGGVYLEAKLPSGVVRFLSNDGKGSFPFYEKAKKYNQGDKDYLSNFVFRCEIDGKEIKGRSIGWEKPYADKYQSVLEVPPDKKTYTLYINKKYL